MGTTSGTPVKRRGKELRYHIDTLVLTVLAGLAVFLLAT
jgi:hypothetical protein